jgi:hypothetical protein
LCYPGRGSGARGLIPDNGFGHLLEIRLKNIFIKTEHKAFAGNADGRMIIQAGHSLVPASTIHALIFV